MTITGVSSTSTASFAQPSSVERSAFRDLVDAIQSGDLATAQSAFTSLTQADPNLLTSSPLGQDLSAIGQALQAGDTTGAQQALDALKTDAQKIGGGHHHHHHHAHRAGATQGSTQGVDPTANTPAGANGTPGVSATEGSTFTITV
jgi:DNA-binding FadR family transcriptional regulator